MAYPEPIPDLSAKDAKEFEKKLSKFKLSETQKKFYKQGRERFQDSK
jgi:hypothetical protein